VFDLFKFLLLREFFDREEMRGLHGDLSAVKQFAS
jgi:hypothetical protein